MPEYDRNRCLTGSAEGPPKKGPHHRARRTMKLTERRIETLTVVDGRKDRLVFDSSQRGLAVRVTAKGRRSYLVQYTLHGQKHRVPLGSFDAFSLANARDAAAAIMGAVAKGEHPALLRREAAAH